MATPTEKNTTKVDAVKCPYCGKVWVPRKKGALRCSGCWRIVER